MVLEHLFPQNWLEKRAWYAFLLAFIYTSLSLFVARVLFPRNTGIVSVALITLLLMPYIRKLISKEEKEEEREKKVSFKHLWRDNYVMVKVYGALFLGIYFSCMLYSFFLPMVGLDTGKLLDAQLALDKGMRGSATGFAGASGLFFEIFVNNWWVLLVTFGLALIVEEGAFFFVVWNASAWGAVLGYRAFAASMVAQGTSVIGTKLVDIALLTLPHVLLEGGAYILAVIAGQIISAEVIKQSKEMRRFLVYMVFLMAGYVLVYWLVRSIFPTKELFSVLSIVLMLVLLFFCAGIFTDKRHKEVFYYNYYLFIGAVLLFIIGALVETFVLINVRSLQAIYAQAMMYTAPALTWALGHPLLPLL